VDGLKRVRFSSLPLNQLKNKVMEVRAITKYVFKGKEYRNLGEIRDHLHNVIGEEVLDKINRVCPPEQHKNFIKMLDVLCSPSVREVLNECLNVTFLHKEEENGLFESEEINVLDIK
jgi:hypothetical protein